MYCVNDKNKSMTYAQILVNNRLHILLNNGTKTSLQLLLCLALERGCPHIIITQKWPFLTIFSISKDNPLHLYNAYNKLSTPPLSVRYKILCGRPQISIAIYRVSRYFFHDIYRGWNFEYRPSLPEGGRCPMFSALVPIGAIFMRPSSLGVGRILRRTLSVCPSVRPSS